GSFKREVSLFSKHARRLGKGEKLEKYVDTLESKSTKLQSRKENFLTKLKEIERNIFRLHKKHTAKHTAQKRSTHAMGSHSLKKAGRK
ncbi:hypothetical protein HY546_01035, partial [archaeon]|nr:hypothetical protein [archaeon]